MSTSFNLSLVLYKVKKKEKRPKDVDGNGAGKGTEKQSGCRNSGESLASQRDGDNPWAKMAGSDRFVDNLRLGRVGGDKGTGQDRTRAFGTLPAKLPGSAHCYQTVVNASGPVDVASPVTLFERQCVRTTEDGETGLSHRENARQARPQIIWTSIKPVDQARNPEVPQESGTRPCPAPLPLTPSPGRHCLLSFSYETSNSCPTPPAEVWGREFATNKCLMDPDNDVHQSRKIPGDPQVFTTCGTEVTCRGTLYFFSRDCGIVLHNLNRSIFILNPTRPSAVYLDRLEAFFHVVLRGPKSGQAGTVYDASRLSSTSRAGMVPLKKLEITFKHVWAGPVGSGRENKPGFHWDTCPRDFWREKPWQASQISDDKLPDDVLWTADRRASRRPNSAAHTGLIGTNLNGGILFSTRGLDSL
ncbi:hypothetical protein Bbelb_234440 [Branchiostoma belcheri]|nr:hypothetical protein Bbelb_234440 [Branchiostoma belcheri]